MAGCPKKRAKKEVEARLSQSLNPPFLAPDQTPVPAPPPAPVDKAKRVRERILDHVARWVESVSFDEVLILCPPNARTAVSLQMLTLVEEYERIARGGDAHSAPVLEILCGDDDTAKKMARERMAQRKAAGTTVAN